MLLPPKKDGQALVPCKDVEQRSLDRTFDCIQSHGTVPALTSVKMPVSLDLLTNRLFFTVQMSLSFEW